MQLLVFIIIIIINKLKWQNRVQKKRPGVRL